MLNNAERLVLEGVKSMLASDAKLGLKFHKAEKQSNFGVGQMHEQIDDLFRLKINNFRAADSITRAFRHVHNYKYIDDPHFTRVFSDEMRATAVPLKEQEKALKALNSVMEQIRKDEGSERDFGYTDLNEMRGPEQDLEFEITDSDLNDENVKPVFTKEGGAGDHFARERKDKP